MKKFPFLLLLLTAGISSCTKHNPKDAYFDNILGSFVQSYVIGDDLIAVPGEAVPGDHEVSLGSIAVSVDADAGSTRWLAQHTCSSSEDIDLFKDLSARHNDTNYQKELIPGFACFYKDFVSIDVICNEDFDDNHKAGTSIADIVRYQARSPFRWISNGYKPDEHCGYSGEFDDFDMPLSDVNSSNMTMLEAGQYRRTSDYKGFWGIMWLQITSKPAFSTKCNVTVILEADDGTVSELPVTVDFGDSL